MVKIYYSERCLVFDNQNNPDARLVQPEDISNIIHEIESNNDIKQICISSPNEQDLWKKYTAHYKRVQAAGGLVINEKNELLFIFRRGKWDLPKGKAEKGEPIHVTAIREVEEETGLAGVVGHRLLCETWHTYVERGKNILKSTAWFLMSADSHQPLCPQTSEDISEIRWIPADQLEIVLSDTFPSVKDVIFAWVSINSL